LILALTGISFKSCKATLTQYRIDADQNNSYAVVANGFATCRSRKNNLCSLKMTDSLLNPASRKNVRVENGTANLKFNLPRQEVSLLILTGI
jgi:hypothetical protein